VWEYALGRNTRYRLLINQSIEKRRSSMPDAELNRQDANQEAFRRLGESEPVLEDIRPALDVLPGMTRETILTSGPARPWTDYVGGQRAAIIGGAL
jgi:hypothetical protein